MNFISPFKRFAYGNTYIYNLVDYFSRHMYQYPTSGVGTNDVIILFDYIYKQILSLMQYI